MQGPGTLFIIAAPSGAGKTSLVKGLVETVRELVVSISYTTRPLRKSEQEGVNYFFVKQKQFDDMVNQGLFLEHAAVFGYYYGTSRAWVEEQLQRGYDVILEIDWQGARQVKQIKAECVTIFILPPSFESLRQRLLARGQDDPHTIDERMEQAHDEISHYHEFDYLVINADFKQALKDLTTIIQATRLLFAKQKYRYHELLKSLFNSSC